jgi:hypothetical protein
LSAFTQDICSRQNVHSVSREAMVTRSILHGIRRTARLEPGKFNFSFSLDRPPPVLLLLLFFLTRVLHLLGWAGTTKPGRRHHWPRRLPTEPETASALRAHVLLHARHLTRLGRMALPPAIYPAARAPAFLPGLLAARSFGSVAARARQSR